MPPPFAPKKQREVYAIDPATRVLGWAKFVVNSDGTSYLDESGFIKQPSHEDDDSLAWIDRLDKMIADTAKMVGLRAAFHGLPVDILIELPDTYAGSRGSAASASGAIMKLSSFVFALRQEFKRFDLRGGKVILYPVRRWKGTTKKEITQTRARKHWGWAGRDHNEADAVGIGDYHIRKVLKRRPYVRPTPPTQRSSKPT